MKTHVVAVAAALSLALVPVVAQEQHDHAGTPAERLGKVHFETSCDASLRADFDRAVALLHSFWFPNAIDAFNGVAAGDPGCGIAHWGTAMANWGNPLTGTRSAAVVSRGLAAVAKAKAAGAKTARERDYISAVELLYANAEQLDQAARVVLYEQAMRKLAAANPTDTEAAIFHAISLDAAAPPTDKTYANQLEAAGILEKAFAVQPDHPGIAHYLIHSYDVPALAAKGLPAARRYASIAPDAPHALHMPSHIFTRVGAWQDSIDANIASAAAAKRANAPAEGLHAMDYQVYAYLQLARDDDALRLWKETEQMLAAGAGNGFAVAAIPARVALERGAWNDAAELTVRPGQASYVEAMTWFAKAIGAARSGHAATARLDAAKLTPLRDALRERKEDYWAGQVEIQRKAAEGWTLHAEGRTADAVSLLREAAKEEDATEKAAVTPGPLAPARELLAELLLATGKAKEALVEYEAVMAKEPGRFRAISGAARSAQAAGDRAKAQAYSAVLLALAKSASPGRPDLAEARKILGVGPRLP